MEQKELGRLLAFAAILFFLPAPSRAVIIDYELLALGGGQYEYTYSVTNDDLAIGIEEFTIFFDLGLYDNLLLSSVPTDWDPLLIQPDPALPDDGFFDALALTSGIALGDTVSGFSVSFTWLGSGLPGDQSFDIVDPFTFDIVTSGLTVPSSAIPVPASPALILTGIGMLLGFLRRCQGVR